MTQALIVGAMSHMGIDATARAAFDLGFECGAAPTAELLAG